MNKPKKKSQPESLASIDSTPEEVRTIEVAISNLNKRTSHDHALAAVKAILNAVPTIGGAIASLISDYIPSSKEKRLVEFTESLYEALVKLHGRVNSEYIQTDEFAFLFEQCFRSVSENYHKETLLSLRHVLLNSAIRFDVEQNLKEELMRIAGSLAPAHLYVLGFYANPGDDDRYDFNTPSKLHRSTFDPVYSIAGWCLPDAEESLVLAVLSRLEAEGLILPLETPIIDALEKRGLIRPNASQRGPWPIYELSEYVTPLGEAFLEFIVAPDEADSTVEDSG